MIIIEDILTRPNVRILPNGSEIPAWFIASTNQIIDAYNNYSHSNITLADIKAEITTLYSDFNLLTQAEKVAICYLWLWTLDQRNTTLGVDQETSRQEQERLYLLKNRINEANIWWSMNIDTSNIIDTYLWGLVIEKWGVSTYIIDTYVDAWTWTLKLYNFTNKTIIATINITNTTKEIKSATIDNTNLVIGNNSIEIWWNNTGGTIYVSSYQIKTIN